MNTVNDIIFFTAKGPNTLLIIDLTEVTAILYNRMNSIITIYIGGARLDIPEPEDGALERIVNAWKAVKKDAAAKVVTA